MHRLCLPLRHALRLWRPQTCYNYLVLWEFHHVISMQLIETANLRALLDGLFAVLDGNPCQWSLQLADEGKGIFDSALQADDAIQVLEDSAGTTYHTLH